MPGVGTSAMLAEVTHSSMPCKKTELVGVINSYAAARASGDTILINMAAEMLQKLVDSLGFAPEEEPNAEISEEA